MAVGRQGGENGIISHKLTLRLPFLRGALSVWKGLHNVPNALHRHCRWSICSARAVWKAQLASSFEDAVECRVFFSPPPIFPTLLPGFSPVASAFNTTEWLLTGDTYDWQLRWCKTRRDTACYRSCVLFTCFITQHQTSPQREADRPNPMCHEVVLNQRIVFVSVTI